jgi:hypothetical protein
MIPLGFIIPIPVALPNVLWAILPRSESTAVEREPDSMLARTLGPVEAVGRIAVFVVPLLLNPKIDTVTDWFCLGVAVVALVLYYAGWARYFLKGRRAPLLLQEFLGIPLPLAVAPVLYFLAAAVLTRSFALAGVSLAFGLAHICLSWKKTQFSHQPGGP